MKTKKNFEDHLQGKYLVAHNDQSEKEIQLYRDQVTVEHTSDWAQYFVNWRQKQEIELQDAKQERIAIYKQNQELIRKVDLQSSLLHDQQQQIQQLTDELNQRLTKEKAIEDKRAKRKAAKKQPLRDAITPEEFQLIIENVYQLTDKSARIKVALTLLYLTGLRVSNLLQFHVSNLQELITKQSTLVHIIKRGGSRKIILPSDAKHWLQRVKHEIELITKGKSPQDPLFTNKQGHLISREQFNKQLNQTLKLVAMKTGKRIYTHSFRVTMVTELLQQQPIQNVKNIVGHKDIRTTELYNRNFMGEREFRKAIQYVFKKRKSQSKDYPDQDHQDDQDF